MLIKLQKSGEVHHRIVQLQNKQKILDLIEKYWEKYIYISPEERL